MSLTHFIAVALVCGAVHGLCPDRWTQFHGACYFLYRDHEEWAQANYICGFDWAKLVSIDSSEENEFIKSMMKASQSQHVWIGAYDMVTEGDFRWVGSKEKLNFTDWSAGEPNSQTDDENCVEVSVNLNCQWNDDICTVKKQFICEGSPGVNMIG